MRKAIFDFTLIRPLDRCRRTCYTLVTMKETNLAEVIHKARQEYGATREEIAVALGCSAATIGRWERGETIPLPVYLRRWKEVEKLLKKKRDAGVF